MMDCPGELFAAVVAAGLMIHDYTPYAGLFVSCRGSTMRPGRGSQEGLPKLDDPAATSGCKRRLSARKGAKPWDSSKAQRAQDRRMAWGRAFASRISADRLAGQVRAGRVGLVLGLIPWAKRGAELSCRSAMPYHYLI
jgi:hypothetical protein